MSKFRLDAPARLIEGLKGRPVKVGGDGKRMGAIALSSEPVCAVVAEEGREETGGRKTCRGANTVT